MSQPTKRECNVDQPGEVDSELNEFWVGNPFEIFMSENLSSFERNRMFLNDAQGNFLDVSYPVELDADSDGRSSVPVDIDNDGRLDLLLRQAGGGPLVIMKNTLPGGNYLKVTLRGRKSNSQGIGARLTAATGAIEITRELYPVNTYRSQRPAMAHFGLDNSDSVDELSIRWPSGMEQSVKQIPANQHIVVTEGESGWEMVIPGKTIAP